MMTILRNAYNIKLVNFESIIRYCHIFILCFLPSFYSQTLYDGTHSTKLLIFAVLISLILKAILFRIISLKQISLYLKPIDVFLILLYSYITINSFLINDQQWGPKHFELILLLLLYAFLRFEKRSNQQYYLTALIIGVTLQCCLGYLQVYNVIPSLHNSFKVTGSFFNPGPFAGYLASIFPILLGFFVFNSTKSEGKTISKLIMKPTFLIVSALIILTIIPVTESRAGIIGLITSSFFLLISKFSFKKLQTYIKRNKIVYFLIPLIVFIIYHLYSFKEKSSIGRMLIWNNTLSMIDDNFMLGSGQDSYAANYMTYQAKHFKSNLNSQYVDVADDVKYAFNEFLQLWVENGLFAVAIVTLALRSIFIKGTNERVIICQACLISIIVFSMFSYPLQILPIKINVLLYLSVIASYQKNIYVLGLSKIKLYLFKAIIIPTGIIGLYCNLNYVPRLYYSYRSWSLAKFYYMKGAYAKSLLYYTEINGEFKNEGIYLTQYGKVLSMLNSPLAIEILKSAEEKENSTIVQLALGNSYQGIKQYDLAKNSYRMAHYMVPNKLYSKYLLANLFMEIDSPKEATQTAKEVLQMKVKVSSEASKQIRQEMQGLVLKYSR